MSISIHEDLILGLDLGSNSLGWALLKTNNNEYKGLVDCGVRIFEAGMDGDISSGNAESRCANRRDKRLIRRQLWRRRRRMQKLKRFLQNFNLLPLGDDIEEIIQKVDHELLKKYYANHIDSMPSKDVLPHVLPYYIRARALDTELAPHELGRALYHLAQRRGFLSNRKVDSGNDDETGKVKSGISELTQKIVKSKSRTLGEYFSSIDPRKERIRERYTSRQMFVEEFNAICDKQTALISNEKRKNLFNVIFKQKPLKSVKHLIGKCILDPNERRAPMYNFAAQKFRYLSALNNLIIATPGETNRTLTSEEWTILAKALEGETGELDQHGNLKYTKAKKLLHLPKSSKFTIEEGGEKSIKGNRTNANLAKVFEENWSILSEYDKDDIIQDLRSYSSIDGLKKRGVKHWKLSEERAAEFAKINLEDDYCNLSLKTIDKLLPHLEEGRKYMEAVKIEYPGYFLAESQVYDLLPMVEDCVKDLRNPVVMRCLSEVRKVVNAIIRKYGKPGKIKIELARDLKNSNKQKKKLISQHRENEKQRENAKKLILDEAGIENPSRDDVLKVILWEECNRTCPYTQKTISINALLRDSQFDIEHIIPFSRCLDNSFLNKTLCYHEENRNIKKNKTPFEAYNGTEKYDAMLHAVAKFNGKDKHVAEKLRRFQMNTQEVKNFFQDFSARQLNDTRYASKATIKYLSKLYGGISDEESKKRIFGVAGGITYIVRTMHGLNNILGDGIKSRDDHRHHAVDAIAIALTSDKTIKFMTDRIKKLDQKQLFTKFKTYDNYLAPFAWDSFEKDIRNSIGNIIASHHVSKKVSGALHEETFYSKPYPEKNEKGKNVAYRHERVALANLESKKIDSIIDPQLKQIIIDKLEELGENDPKKAFKNGQNLPILFTREGKPHSIVKKVRIKRKQDTVSVGQGKRERNVVGGNNHHMEIVAVIDDEGNEIKWEGHVVSMLEAYNRKRKKEPIVKRYFGPGKRFKFSLACGDILELENEEIKRLCIIRTVPLSQQIMFVKINDSRKQSDIKATGEWFSSRPGSLKDKNPIKYSITPLGELRRTND